MSGKGKNKSPKRKTPSTYLSTIVSRYAPLFESSFLNLATHPSTVSKNPAIEKKTNTYRSKFFIKKKKHPKTNKKDKIVYPLAERGSFEKNFPIDS